MSESLLLQAQSLRLEGELDTSVDLLRVVLSQCNSDLRGKDEEGEAGRTDESRSNQQQLQQESPGVATTRRLRNVAAYQLALLLLQRSGRQIMYGSSPSTPHCNDENEADELLWKLGYRLRLSNRAFGYPVGGCTSCHRRGDNNIPSPTVSGSMQHTCPQLAVIDDALPVTLFQGLVHAFRPDSRYWSEFYCKANDDVTAEDGKNPKQQKANQFASHNIPLPNNGSSPSLPITSPSQHHLQQSNSILEQVAIITQHKLREHFPEVMNATSVEVWSHRRPPDGQHQLHYDMDEILLYRHRKEYAKQSGKVSDEKDLQYTESKSVDKDSAKRRKTSHGTADCKASGISCPIVSCVLTIQVPGQSKACSNCGDPGNNAPPTIVCNQSIVQRNGNDTNIGYLCYPRPNRLLAFEGSLLHGVVPGIPSASSSASDAEDGNSSDDDFYGFGEAEQKQSSSKEQRITLMMGFWKEVCLSNPDETSSADMVGPNVPFQSILSDQTWTREFNPISINDDESIAQLSKDNTNSKAIDVVNPLWKAVNQKGSSPDDKSFGGYTLCNEANQFYGRFFLKSTETTEVDKEVLSGA